MALLPLGARPDVAVASDAGALAEQLRALQSRLFPPTARKALRRFSSGEAARLIGVSDGYLRSRALAEVEPPAEVGPNGRRHYTLDTINALRRQLADGAAAAKGRTYLPGRGGAEHLQVVVVTNFKGGSGKTTTAAHLAQYLALRGYRVLAIDLDPQASLSALLGQQPEFDVGDNETLYGAVRYDDERRPMREVVRRTYFAGLDLVPGNLELQEYEHDTPRVLAERDRSRGSMFWARIAEAIGEVEADYDVVVIDCPPQLGYLTLGALCAATSVLVTVHPQMLDVASMSQFLRMTAELLRVVQGAGGRLQFDFLRYLVTRHEPNDGPQQQVVAFLRSLFQDRVLTHMALKSTAVSDAGLSKQTLYEVGRENFHRSTYDRAMESLDAVNGEVEALLRRTWGRVG